MKKPHYSPLPTSIFAHTSTCLYLHFARGARKKKDRPSSRAEPKRKRASKYISKYIENQRNFSSRAAHTAEQRVVYIYWLHTERVTKRPLVAVHCIDNLTSPGGELRACYGAALASEKWALSRGVPAAARTLARSRGSRTVALHPPCTRSRPSQCCPSVPSLSPPRLYTRVYLYTSAKRPGERKTTTTTRESACISPLSRVFHIISNVYTRTCTYVCLPLYGLSLIYCTYIYTTTSLALSESVCLVRSFSPLLCSEREREKAECTQDCYVLLMQQQCASRGAAAAAE